MRLGFSILVGVLAMLVAGRIAVGEPLRVSALEGRANTAAQELTTAQIQERRTRDAQAILANRIAALKRDRNSTDDALLERLLRESIDADRALAGQIKKTRRSQQAALQALREAFEQIEARVNQLRPSIADESQPMTARKQAAREIADLLAVRKRLVRLLEEVNGRDQTRHTEWADHVVAIDPLDGPSELADKDAVLALTQKKIEQKKALLARLIREKKISQAARDFAVDATALDDDLRTGRVSRRGSGEAPLAFTETNDSNRSPPAAPTVEGDQAAGFGAPAEQDDSPTPPPSDPTRDATLGAAQPQVGVTSPKTAVRVNQPAAFPSISVAKQIDPNVLINLRVEELDADTYDLATLKKYIAELESMQKALASQAQKIKNRAQQLEKDEARTQSK